jgi:predicted RNA binding protein YcfA (HicA-like mRNA interferase family)
MPITGEEMLKLYIKNGWIVIRKKGSHRRVAKGKHRETIQETKKTLKKGLEIYLLQRLQEIG